MSDSSQSSSRPLYGRIAYPNGFLPLASEAVLSTRGQSLQGLIRSRSSASLDVSSQKRHRPNFIDEEANDLQIGGRRTDSRGANESELARGAAPACVTPKMRSMRLIGSNNASYNWQATVIRGQYIKSEEDLKGMKAPLRRYYERTNSLIEQYMYIDQLLDSSLPHSLIQEYGEPSIDIPYTIDEEGSSSVPSQDDSRAELMNGKYANGEQTKTKLKRTPKNLYRVPKEDTPLLDGAADGGQEQVEEESDNSRYIVQVAIYVNLAANTILLAGKIVVIVLTSSLSVLASLVDAVLDFLSTAIVWTTTRLMAQRDQYAYPIGRRRLEPIGILVFSVIIVTSFFQVLLESFNRLTNGNHTVVRLTLPAILIMASTVVIKFLCWLWCRLIKNSSVQALAQDAMTDVVFNIFSIIFPLIGYYAQIWYLDALGGALLSLYVIQTWMRTSTTHIRNLTGASASEDQVNVLLYLTMRFAHAIQQIQNLQAYHAGDGLNVEVDIVLNQNMPLRDSHDLGESLQYVLESVPFVDRAFVHLDYAGWNLPSHMNQVDD